MGPCPRDAPHPPRARREPGSRLRARGTSEVPPPRVPCHPALAREPESRCKSQRVRRAAAAQRGAGPATAVTVNYKVLEPHAAVPLVQQQSR